MQVFWERESVKVKKDELNGALPGTDDVITGQKHNVGGGPRRGEPNHYRHNPNTS